MPPLGLGTWKAAGGEVGHALEQALRMGYRHIDCAAIYGNEAEIGEALRKCFAEGVLQREELWVTSKLWNDCHAKEHVEVGLRRTLEDLGLDYLDLYLIHWPVAQPHGVIVPEGAGDLISLEECPIAETWSGMEAAVDAGLCRFIGVSNFSVKKLEQLLEVARIRPGANQVESHPYLQQRELVDFCRERDIAVTAYSPLGSSDRPERMKASDEPVLLQDETIAEIARRTDATPAQVLIAWALQRGTATIPKSVHPGRMRENLEAARIRLSEQDMEQIARLERGRRYVTGSFWVHEGGPYTLANLWDE